jgi:hypothetical protein
MKSVLFALFAVVSLISFGCSGMNKIGTVGDTTFYNVHASNIDGPNVSALVAEKDGQASVVSNYGGAGVATQIGTAAVEGASQVMAAHEFGHDLRPDQTSISSSNANSGNNGASANVRATGGNSQGSSATSGSTSGATNNNHDASTNVNRSVDNSVHDNGNTNNGATVK